MQCLPDSYAYSCMMYVSKRKKEQSNREKRMQMGKLQDKLKQIKNSKKKKKTKMKLEKKTLCNLL